MKKTRNMKNNKIWQVMSMIKLIMVVLVMGVRGADEDLSDVSELFQLSLSDFESLVDTDISLEIGSTVLEPERVLEFWNGFAISEFDRCADLEKAQTNILTIREAMCPYLMCMTSTVYATSNIRKSVLLSILRDISIYRKYIESDLTSIFNFGDTSCYSTTFLSSTIVNLATFLQTQQYTDFELKFVPLNSRMKIDSGLVQDVMRIAKNYMANAGDILTPQGRRQRRYLANDTLPEEVNPEDLMPNTHSVELTLCSGMANSETYDVTDKITNLLNGKSPDGSSSLISYYALPANYTWDDIDTAKDIPERWRFWKKVYEIGIDGDGCSSMISDLQFDIAPIQSRGYESAHSFTVSFATQETAFNTTTSLSCALSLVTAVTLLPQVCSVSMSKAFETQNTDAASILLGAKGNQPPPFFDMGLTGKGQIVAVSDTGIDVNNCYFWDQASSPLAKDGVSLSLFYGLKCLLSTQNLLLNNSSILHASFMVWMVVPD